MRAKLVDLGIDLDPWQVAASKLTLAKRSDGLYAAGIGGVVWSIPRQVGKTFTLGGTLLSLCLIESDFLVLWTSHSLRTTGETFRAMKAMCQRPGVRPWVLGIHNSHTEPSIEFVNGSRILFGSRERGFGVGFTKVGGLVFDEAQRASQRSLDDMIPTTMQHPNPLVIYVGTPPTPVELGEVFTEKRNKALGGESDNVFYMEFGADPECDPQLWPKGHVDWDQVAKANPSFPHRTPRASILRLMEQLGAESFRRAGLGLWVCDSGTPPLIDEALWRRLKAAPPKGEATLVYGVKFDVASSGMALAVAEKPPDGPVHVAVIDEKPLTSGIGWLVEFLAGPRDGRGPRWRDAAQIVIDGKGNAGVLAMALHEAGVGKTTVLLPTVDQVITYHAAFFQRVVVGGLAHQDQPGLNDAVSRGCKRSIGAQGGWGWASVTGESVLSLGAATMAVGGVLTTKRRLGRGGGEVR
jgi:hypothetical protein